MAENVRQLDWAIDPLDVLGHWPDDRRVAMLHSGRSDPRWATWSLIAEPVGSYRFVDDGEGGRSEWVGDAAACPFLPASLTHQPFTDLRLLLDAPGIWIGMLSYDLGRWIESLPDSARDDRRWPVIELAYCPVWYRFDLATERWSGHGNPKMDLGQVLLEKRLAKLAPRSEAAESTPPVFETAEPGSVFSREAYEAAVARCIELIGEGDIFQANLAQRFTTRFAGRTPQSQRSLYGQLALHSPAWYGAYLELTHDTESFEPTRCLASTSPELFLSVDGDHVITRPIKGTRPATCDANELKQSAKDTAELNMIVDLMRNDLGRVCGYGSVRVSEPRAIESHPTIHHGVATIEGQLHHSKDVIDLLRATLPGGSVTGAPKVRAMQIIDELEPVRRGPYCGSLGVLSRDWSCFNIAIRTMAIEAAPNLIPGAPGGLPGASHLPDQGRVDFSVGGGIVADSRPDAEYQETLDKAAAMLRALSAGHAIGATDP